jgi:hypothetical protein
MLRLAFPYTTLNIYMDSCNTTNRTSDLFGPDEIQKHETTSRSDRLHRTLPISAEHSYLHWCRTFDSLDLARLERTLSLGTTGASNFKFATRGRNPTLTSRTPAVASSSVILLGIYVSKYPVLARSAHLVDRLTWFPLFFISQLLLCLEESKSVKFEVKMAEDRYLYIAKRWRAFQGRARICGRLFLYPLTITINQTHNKASKRSITFAEAAKWAGNKAERVVTRSIIPWQVEGDKNDGIVVSGTLLGFAGGP